ncbi:MAG: DMT family transporter [Gemmatimonadota bacterium]
MPSYLAPAILWMVIAQLMFTGMNVLSRLAARDLHWSEVAGARFLFGALVTVLIARAQGTSLRSTDRRNTWFRSIFGTIAALCFFYSVTSPRIPLGDAITLGATAPIFVALLSVPMLGERVGRHVALAVVLAFAGIVAVAQPTFHNSAADVALIATLSALCYALAMIWLRKIGPNESSEAIVLHFSIVAAAANLLWSIPVWVTPGWRSVLLLVGTGVTGGIGQVAMTRAFARSRAAPLSVLGYLSIIFTYLLAIPIFGERVSPLQVGGAALVIAAGVLLAQDAIRMPVRPGAIQVGEVVAKD